MTALAVATMVALSGTSVAHAQLSSLSSNATQPSDYQPPAPKSNEQRLLEVSHEYDLALGHTPNARAEEMTEDLLDQALAGELWYADNIYTTYGGVFSHQGQVIRIPRAYVEAYIYEMERATPEESRITAPFGIAVASDADYYYVAEVFLL